jgi:rsbT antagonist protein RsbS
MEKIPILRMGQFLLVTIQVDLYDRLAENLESDLVHMVRKTGARGVLIAMMTKILDAETVVVGMQPAVAITLIELGLPLKGVHSALNVERGMDMLRSKIALQDGGNQDDDTYNSIE